jgi:predicted metal-dependent hydrolase
VKLEIIDQNALINLINQAKAKVQADYTAASWAVFVMALGDAENYLQNTPDDKKTKVETDNRYNELENAMNNLILAAPIVPTNPTPVSQTCDEGQACSITLNS